MEGQGCQSKSNYMKLSFCPQYHTLLDLWPITVTDMKKLEAASHRWQIKQACHFERQNNIKNEIIKKQMDSTSRTALESSRIEVQEESRTGKTLLWET